MLEDVMAIGKSHRETYEALQKALESYHQELDEINIEQAKLEKRRAIVKAVAETELASLSNLNLDRQTIISTVAGCW
jgi:hypothetical protein